MSYFDSFGTLRYSPKRLGEQASPNWFVVLDCDPAIGAYVRKLYAMASYECSRLERAAHITVVRNETPPTERVALWEKHAGLQVWLRVFLGKPSSNGFYWWLPVYCPAANVIRAELGLDREPQVPLHLTIGHLPEQERAKP